ncbi:MAG: hypothetical protein COV66_02320 [Nitrospinae bacterium CG11_big_fil_rev_8_21_14_0_20_45_15]|nr:MAG: hypothetical protein COV66_02320 [Nitrospinae bacterium CG11_big_fil_rev_8_21_14_0_20_45_15]
MNMDMICDVCNTVVSHNLGKIVSAKDFKTLMTQGFGIHKTNIEMLTSSGISQDEAINILKQQYATSTTDWFLCPQCEIEATEAMRGNGSTS